jgi:CDP-paratose 2-epimerase
MRNSRNGPRPGANGTTPPAPAFGLLEWFHFGDRQRVEEVLADARALGVTQIRTGLSWADSHRPDGMEWYDWLLPRLCKEVTILPCLTYTPPSEGIVPKSSSPPRHPDRFAFFVGQAIERWGKLFDTVELWNEPNGLVDWDWRLDPDWGIFSSMIESAASRAKSLGKKTALGGMCPVDQNWLNFMCRRGVLENIDIVGIHGFPGTWEFDWTDWAENLRRVREVLQANKVPAEVWITEVGYSTWRHDDYTQLLHFKQVMEAEVERIYWYSVRDLKTDHAHQEGFWQDQRHYHLGLKTHDGQPKLLYRILENEGVAGVRSIAEMVERKSLPQIYTTPMATAHSANAVKTPPIPGSNGKSGRKPVLITGGAGFIGTNLAHRLLTAGQPVLVYDNLSRPGAEENLDWLCRTHGDLLQVEIADVRDRFLVQEAVREVSQVYHFAAQVAVTSSLESPAFDFDVNAKGTLNVLEALRAMTHPPPLVFTSTNKIYGELSHIRLEKLDTRYEAADPEIRLHGVSEQAGLNFHSPYGCSKGAADQYVLDYAGSFGIRAVVFRMSCIYGLHQFGNEDQGWLAHFLLRTLQNRPITFYGDGRQVRDALFIDDLVDALCLAIGNIDRLSGRAFNIGGGPGRTTSLIELTDLIGQIDGAAPVIRHEDWRRADQKYFVSDVRQFSQETGWKPRTTLTEGVRRLYEWMALERTAVAPPNRTRPRRSPKSRGTKTCSRQARPATFLP